MGLQNENLYMVPTIVIQRIYKLVELTDRQTSQELMQIRMFNVPHKQKEVLMEHRGGSDSP